MGNVVRCLFPRIRREVNNELNGVYLIDSRNLLFHNNPIVTAFQMLSSQNDDESFAMALNLSSSVAAVTNGDQSESDLRFLLEYLQISLPIDCALSGSIASLIIREASLPSRAFLRQVSEVLQLDQLTNQLTAVLVAVNTTSITTSTVAVDSDSEMQISENDETQRLKSLSRDPADMMVPRDKAVEQDLQSQQLLLKCHNACLVIDCLASLLCGPNANYLLNQSIVDFLIACCQIHQVQCNKTDKFFSNVWLVVLRSILCFEKFALTKSCMDFITGHLSRIKKPVPFMHLEVLCDSDQSLQREVGFCSQWLLDNIYTVPGRTLSYKTVDRTNLNAIMNIKDASQYIKLSPNGLEVRCDSDSFESVRCTFEVSSGVFYYEAKLITAGIMQIGWATKRSQYMNHDGIGIGDDMFSCAYDGCRKVIWYNGRPQRETHLPNWKPGDILGCLINTNKKFLVFSLNGNYTDRQTLIFTKTTTGFYAGASFYNNQHCLFNFGRTYFKYFPNQSSIAGCSCSQIKTFNSFGHLTNEEVIVYPRRIQLAQTIQSQESTISNENSCKICFSNSANVILEPCHHNEFCRSCIIKVDMCPVCRSPIKSIKTPPQVIFHSATGATGHKKGPAEATTSSPIDP